jgi:hypothetical protein
VQPPRWLPLAWAIVCVAAGACGDTITGNKPAGKTVDSDAQLQRYLRRAYLDLSGSAPGDSELGDATARLRDAGNTAAAREVLVDDLIGRDGFTTLWLGELDSAVFGGATLEQQYTFVCALIRALAPPCMSCTATDACSCSCAAMQPYAAERSSLRASAADLKAGTTTATIERRYAMATAYYILVGTPENRVKALFDDFLARAAEADEIENGRAMIVGALFPGQPAGLMFHRLGGSYADLIDIVFHSEVYREAMVRRVFDRYLARSPSATELAHFVATLNATDPDLRGVVRAVVASREYFDQ